MATGYISTGMGDCFGALLVSLMALQLMLVDRNPYQPCCYQTIIACYYHVNKVLQTVFSSVIFEQIKVLKTVVGV